MTHTITLDIVNLSKKKIYPAGITLFEVLKDIYPNNYKKYLVALVNHRSRALSYPLYFPRRIEFLDISSSTGHRAYRHSLAFLLYKAINDLYPEAQLRIEHAISGGYYCLVNHVSLDNKIISPLLKKRMMELIASDIPFVYHTEDSKELILKLEESKLCDKIKLIKEKGDLYTSYYSLEHTIDSYYSCLVPSTSYLALFDLQAYHKGLLLSAPLQQQADTIAPLIEQPKLLDVFSEFAEWNRKLEINNVADINEKIESQEITNFIMLAEALQEKKVVKISEMIQEHDNTRLIMISGPSSSGKTTFSKRLELQLKLSGIQPVTLSLDDYYVNRELSPRDENGEYDYEHIEALDLPLLNKQLQSLLDGEEVYLPKYSFKDGKRTFSSEATKLHANEALVLEGIHALNPHLTKAISEKVKFKIYVSALTTISLDNHNYISTRDNRLIRRIVRDFYYRGTSAEANILRWQSVRKGEDRWIFPYQEEADIMFNSSLLFELPVLKSFVEPILKEVKHNSKAYIEARRLLKFLSFFRAIDHRKIPPTSLLREFVGGSSFKY